MTTPHNEPRRTFLKNSLLGLAVGSVAGSTRSPLRAAEPERKGRGAHFKLSLAAYSFNRFLPRNGKPGSGKPAMTLDDVIDTAADLNLDGVELTGYYFPEPVTDAELHRLANRCFRAGLDISGTAIGNNFCLPEGPAREAQLKMTRTWIDRAAILGAPVIRIFAGTVPKGDTEAAAVERCVEGIKTSLDYAAEKGVFLALENHGGVTADPDEMLAIIDAVGPHDWFGVNFDSGNFQTADPYAALEKIAPHAINAQIKVMMRPNGGRAEADFGRIVDILRRANYRGYLVLEYEENNHAEEIPKAIEELRDAIGWRSGD